MVLFQDCDTKEKVLEKLETIRDSGLTSYEVEWSARFRILELESADFSIDDETAVSILM